MSGQRDIVTMLATLAAIAPAADQTGNVDSAIIDTRNADGHAFVATLGNLGAGETATLSIYHGDDSGLSDAALAGARDVLAGPSSTNYDGGASTVVIDGDSGETTGRIGYVGSKRYIRLRVALGAGTADLAAVAIQGYKRVEDHAEAFVS